MNLKRDIPRTFSILLVLLLAIGALGASAAHAAQTSPETVPAGLSSADWAQIRGLLRSTLPAQQAYLKASNTQVEDFFGYSVAISGDTLVVGAHREDSSATGINGDESDNSCDFCGAAYVFTRSGGVWSQQAYLKASNTDSGVGGGEMFGWSVAIDGDTVLVSATGEDSYATGVNGDQNNNSSADSGAVYVFTRSGTTWSQQAYLKASNTGMGDGFGYSVSISGDTLVVGAASEDSNATGVNGDQNDNSKSGSGAAYVFSRSGTDWSQQAYLKASNTAAADLFGRMVAISGDTVVVGAYAEDSNATGVNGDQGNDLSFESGAAYVFVRSLGIWSQQAYLKASNTEVSDGFGIAVAISGNTVVIGANKEDSGASGVNGNQGDNSAVDSGAAYVFTRIDTTWSQQAYLKASNTAADDYFGYSVAVSGDTLLVGAPLEDSNATGVNGDEGNNSYSNSGAVYVFTRSGVIWSQQAYLKASNTGASDNFGSSVAAAVDAILIGAPLEDSSATGVNGDQTNNLASTSGAAYVFAQPPTTLSLTLRSVGTYDGHILESGENTNVGGTLDSTSTTFILGDGAADKQYRAVLSFNTATLPDTAVITKVTLKIRRQGVLGTNPFTILGRLTVDIQKPFFGSFPGLEARDFQAAAGKNGVALFGITPVNTWYSALLNATGRAYINKTGTTQFRLRFATDDNNDNAADYMKFYSGNYVGVTARPTLIIEYYIP